MDNKIKLKLGINKDKKIFNLIVLAVLFTGLLTATYLFFSFRSRINRAGSVQYLTCNAPSFATSLSNCNNQNGMQAGIVNDQGDVCCTLSVPESAYPDLSNGSANDILVNNCCNRDEYGSCVGSNNAETIDNFKQGYLACQAGLCGACEYKTDLQTVSGVSASYYSDLKQDALVVTQLESDIALPRIDSIPFEGMPEDNFAIVWEGFVTPDVTEDYVFHVFADDYVRLWVDNRLVIDSLTQSSARNLTGPAYLEAGNSYNIKLLYGDVSGSSEVKLNWETAYSGTSPTSVSNLSTLSRNYTNFPIVQGVFQGIQEDDIVSGSRSVSFTADPDTTTNVAFYVDSELINVDEDPAYELNNGTFNFDELIEGAHTLLAKVYSNIAGAYYEKVVNFYSQASLPDYVDLVAIEDSYVKSSSPSNNYGTDDALEVDASSGKPTKISYLKFDLINVSAPNITKATLFIHSKDVSGADSPDTQSVRTSTSSWSENSITYNTRPPLGEELATLSNTARNTWVALDITSSVLANAGQIYSVGIDSAESNGLDLDSRETSNAPYIRVTYEGTQPTPSATPTATPTAAPSATPTSTPTATPVSNSNWSGINSGDKVWGTIFVEYNKASVNEKYVEFSIDDPNNNVVNFDRKAPFRLGNEDRSGWSGFDVTQLTPGSHNLYARVKDASEKGGGYTYTEAIEIIVEDPNATEGLNLYESTLELMGF